MLLRLISEGRQIDEIQFCDTGLEFPEMYAHIDKIEDFIGRKITRLYPEKPFTYWFREVEVRNRESAVKRFGEQARYGYGWGSMQNRWCTRKLKDEPRNRRKKELSECYTPLYYVGLAADELARLERKNNQGIDQIHPLVEWGMTEQDCLNYCYQHGFDWGGLYTHSRRVSCWLCPLQSLDELRYLYHNRPELWAKLKELDNSTAFSFKQGYRTIEGYFEPRFRLEDEWKSKGKSITSNEFYELVRKTTAQAIRRAMGDLQIEEDCI